MKAYKGFNKSLTSVMGDHIKENCVFVPGETKEVENCKTGRNGFHCCENPFDCLSYYGLGSDNRFFVVEAAGNINEDGSERIACTQITLVEELTLIGLAKEGMMYIINHPDREKWQKRHINLLVQEDKAEAEANGCIAIARGKDPRVKGAVGSILGILKEGDGSQIIDCKLVIVREDTADRWLGLTKDRKLEVCE